MTNLTQKTRKIERHPRLFQLDRELGDPAAQPYGYLTATRGELTVRICVMRSADGRTYTATAKVAGHVHRVSGLAPSHAVVDLVRQMQYALRHAARRAS